MARLLGENSYLQFWRRWPTGTTDWKYAEIQVEIKLKSGIELKVDEIEMRWDDG